MYTEEKTGSSKKMGSVLFALLAALSFFAITFAVVTIRLVSIFFSVLAQSGEGADVERCLDQAVNLFQNQDMTGEFAVYMVSILLVGWWYYRAFLRKQKNENWKSCLRGRNLLLIFLTALAAALITNLYMTAVEWSLPELMAEYEALLESSGIAEWTIGAFASAVVLAPLVEELIYRGLVFSYFKKAGMGFWLANILQALLFGLMHMNWIQGSYAFGLGLLVGCLYRRFETLTAPILFHIIFNFWGAYVTAALGEVMVGSWVDPFIAVAAVVLVIFIRKLWKSEKALP